MKDWPTPQSHPTPPTAVTMSQQLPTPTPAHAPPTHQGRMMSNQAPIAQQRTDEFPCARYINFFDKKHIFHTKHMAYTCCPSKT